MTELEDQLRLLSPQALTAVAGSVLEALRTDISPLTESEIEAAVTADLRTVRSAAAEFGGDVAAAPPTVDAGEVLAVLADNSAEAKAEVKAAINRFEKPQAKLPLPGIGSLELITLAIAAASARPSLTDERGTHLKVKMNGRDDLSKMIKAVLSFLARSAG
jgi:hypothetical protein